MTQETRPGNVRLAWAIAIATVAVALFAIATHPRTAGAQAATSSITVVLETRPDSADDFAFVTEGAGLSAFVLDDDADPARTNRITFPGLAAGAYAVTGPAAPGWTLAGVSCNATGLPGSSGGTVRIALAAGENATCRYIYEQPQSASPVPPTPGAVPATPAAQVLASSITVVVDARDSVASRVSFVASALGGVGFELDDDPKTALPSASTLPALPAGSYVVELVDAGEWTLANVACESGERLVSLSSRRVEFSLDGATSVTCTFELTNASTPAASPATGSITSPATAVTPEATAVSAETPASLGQAPATATTPSATATATFDAAPPLPPQTGTGEAGASAGMRVLAGVAIVLALAAGTAATFIDGRRR